MRTYGTVAVAKQAYSKDIPEAGPVKSYRIEEEFETKIARYLQTIIRIGRPEMKVELEARRQAIQEIILECTRELDKMREAEV